MGKINKEIQTILVKKVLENYEIGKQNNEMDSSNYEAYLDMYDCVRNDREYDWHSNIFIPEFLSQMLIQSSIEASTRHVSRDYVNVYLASSDPSKIKAAEAEKELINRTLNQRHLHFFQKDMRAIIIKNLSGDVYFRCWWEQEIERIPSVRREVRPTGLDINGDPVISEDQIPDIEEVEIPIVNKNVITDRFNFDVMDRRNVFTSNEYTYSLQEKAWVMVRFDTNIDKLMSQRQSMGYFNLKKIEMMAKEGKISGETETKDATSDRSDRKQEVPDAPMRDFMVLEWHGHDWVVVKRKNGQIVDISVGIDKDGVVKKGAEYMRVIKSVATIGTEEILIRFQVSPYKTAKGKQYLPLIRGLCYVHPVRDNGFGDGKGSEDLQAAINDNFNIGQDRVRMASVPIFKAVAGSLEYNRDNYVVSPGALWEVNDINDVQEIQIADNVVGTINQNTMLVDALQKKNASNESVQGQLPSASTKATVAAIANNRTDTRTNYKNITYENTALVDLYWMMSQMTAQFAQPETYEELLGDKVLDFDPALNYSYKTVTEAIESEYSRASKVGMLTQMLGMMTNVPNPNTPKLMNMIITKIIKLFGDEAEDAVSGMLDESFDPTQPQQQQGGAPVANIGPQLQNQNGGMQSAAEQFVRGGSF